MNEQNSNIQNISEQYNRIINQLSNENVMLKNLLDEKMKIIDIFQKVTIEAKEKIDLLIKENQRLFEENNEIKEKLRRMEEEKKEIQKNENSKLQNELNFLKK